MENEKLENKFAMHLSGVLKGMGFKQGTRLLSALSCTNSPLMCSAEDLESADGYKFRSECDVSPDDIEEYGIYMIYFKFNVNATHNEMIDLLEEYNEYDEEWSEEEITQAFWKLFDSICFDLEYDELTEKFDDMQTYWAVLIDEDCHYYRDGDSELYQF